MITEAGLDLGINTLSKSTTAHQENAEYRCPTDPTARAALRRRMAGCTSVFDDMADELKIERSRLRQAIAHARSNGDNARHTGPLPHDRIVIAATALGLPVDRVSTAYENAQNRARARRRIVLEKRLDEAVREDKISTSEKNALLRRYDDGTLGRTWGATRRIVERTINS